MNENLVRENFGRLFGGRGWVYAAPGRINVIGEHTDYNGGFVLPGAVDREIVAEIRFNDTDRVRAFAVDLDESSEFGMDEANLPAEVWARYIFGVCRELRKRGAEIPGFDCAFSGDIPLGAGMSSSAALESTFAFALNDMLGLGLPLMELARVGQATEHNYVGVKCGIMDQFASCHGRAGYLMKLDCKSGRFEYVPFDPERHGYRVVLVDPSVRHELVDSPYNRRRESCERATAAIAVRHPEVEFLGDAKTEWLEEVVGEISMEDYIRAEYVIGEGERLQEACRALERDDYETLGRMMYLTHTWFSKLFEASCPELDFLVEVAKRSGVSGARLMGGGFGGCTINLVRGERYDDFLTAVSAEYKAEYGTDCRFYTVVISDGARRLV